MILGYTWAVSHWRRPICPGWASLYCTNAWSNGLCWSCESSVPWAPRCHNVFEWWHKHGSRTVHRDGTTQVPNVIPGLALIDFAVSHSSTRLHDFHAGGKILPQKWQNGHTLTLVTQAEKHKGTFLAPIGIGLSLFIAELGGMLNSSLTKVPKLTSLTGVYYTGGSLNPARSFGPCVANKQFPHEHWIYWVGPCLGSLVASGFYWFIKSCEYETVNPGQDFDDLEASAYKPQEDLTRPVISPTAVVDRSGSRDLASSTSKEMPRPGGDASGGDGRQSSLSFSQQPTISTMIRGGDQNGSASINDGTGLYHEKTTIDPTST